MLILMLIFCLVLQAVTLALVTGLYIKLFVPTRKDRLERRVEQNMTRDRMDEGVENIMTFSVKGRTGFENMNDEE